MLGFLNILHFKVIDMYMMTFFFATILKICF